MLTDALARGHAAPAGQEANAAAVALTLLGLAGLHAGVSAWAWCSGFRELGFYGAPAGAADAHGGGGGGAEGAGGRGRTPALRLLCSWKMLGVLLVHGGFMFCGMAMKQLLSTIFEQVKFTGLTRTPGQL